MTEKTVEPNKQRKLRRLVLILVSLLVVVGSGAGAGVYAMGGAWLPGSGAKEDPKQPKLVVRDGVSRGKAEAGRLAAAAGSPDPRIFKPTYLALESSFTSNLRDGGSFVQIGLGVSTYYDERVFANLQTHEMAVRSTILMTLAEHDSSQISTASGKAELKEALKNAVNEVLTNKEGFGGIDDVYFTSFITQ